MTTSDMLAQIENAENRVMSQRNYIAKMVTELERLNALVLFWRPIAVAGWLVVAVLVVVR